MFPGMALFTCRIQKGCPQELRHETPYLERLFRTPNNIGRASRATNAERDEGWSRQRGRHLPPTQNNHREQNGQNIKGHLTDSKTPMEKRETNYHSDGATNGWALGCSTHYLPTNDHKYEMTTTKIESVFETGLGDCSLQMLSTRTSTCNISHRHASLLKFQGRSLSAAFVQVLNLDTSHSQLLIILGVCLAPYGPCACSLLTFIRLTHWSQRTHLKNKCQGN